MERSIPVVEVKGESGIGYYSSATARDPGKGFKDITQGILRIGALTAFFTVLSNDGGENIVTDALRMIKGARHMPAKIL